MQIGQPFNPFGLFQGSFIPNCLMRLPATIMSANEKLVWARLGQYAGRDGKCYPSQEILADEVGLLPNTVQIILKKLEQKGFIERIQPTGKDRLVHKHNTYIFLWNEVFEESKMEKVIPDSQVSGPLSSSGSGIGYSSGSLDPYDHKGPYKDIIKDGSNKDNMSEAEKPARTTTSSKSEPLPIFRQYAQQLADIVQTKKNIRLTPSKIKSWSQEIQKLSHQNRIRHDRIQNALTWYAAHIGEDYVPVIESGSSFREKFMKLEAAMNRENKSTSPVNAVKPKRPDTFAQVPKLIIENEDR